MEAVSESREQLLEGGSFDLVVASYSITDERRELVGQAGPYFTTGQQLLIRVEDEDVITGPDDLAGRKVCSVTGSTSLERVVTEYAADPVGFTTYSECVDQLREDEVDAVTTDGAILLGYAAQRPNLFRVVGRAVLRGAVRDRLSQGRRRDVRVPQRGARAVLRRRELGRGVRHDSRHGRRWRRRSPPELDPCDD